MFVARLVDEVLNGDVRAEMWTSLRVWKGRSPSVDGGLNCFASALWTVSFALHCTGLAFSSKISALSQEILDLSDYDSPSRSSYLARRRYSLCCLKPMVSSRHHCLSSLRKRSPITWFTRSTMPPTSSLDSKHVCLDLRTRLFHSRVVPARACKSSLSFISILVDYTDTHD